MYKQPLSVQTVHQNIFIIRGHKVLVDKTLAELYYVETRTLNQAVRRNLKRFPDDFMFEVTREEIMRVSQSVISLKFSNRVLGFTEQGVAMLSGILNRPRAIEANVAIMRAFVQLRKMAITHKDLAEKISELEKESKQHGQNIEKIFEVLRQLLVQEEKPKRRMEFHTD